MKQQVILITGASSGMGKDFALDLIKKGHIVYGAARRLDKMKDLEEAGGHALAMDVTDEQQIDKVVQSILDEQGRIDVLINNAGYAVYGAVETVSMEDARRQFEVNIFGLAAISQKVIPAMRAANSGKIINISSVGGKIYTPLGSWYHASKHALEGWSDCLRLELKPFNIDVVLIEPGIILTEFGDVMYEPMVARAKGTAYESMSTKLAKATKEAYDKGQGSPASVITALVNKAINSPKPKTRYAGGRMAKPLLFIRRFFSDRFFDRIILSQIK
ncbi:MAG: oxidoreductase [Croceimicrobium sp.]